MFSYSILLVQRAKEPCLSVASSWCSSSTGLNKNVCNELFGCYHFWLKNMRSWTGSVVTDGDQ